MIETVPIIYNGGAYGTFVEWCLYYFSGNIEHDLPFNNNGNSHKFNKPTLEGIDAWRNFVRSGNNVRTVRVHPKLYQHENAVSNIIEIISSAKKSVLLYPDQHSIIWNINNKFTKMFNKPWIEHNSDFFFENLKRWNPTIKSVDEMATWQLREFLSHYLLPQHLSELDFTELDLFVHPNVLKISISKLVFDFEKTIKDILVFCNFSIARNNFQEIYNHWVMLQVHKDKDQIVKKIVESVVNNTYYDWIMENLTIVDESFIQMILRDHYNLDLKCYNLDVFPTNTKDLKNLLIPK